MKKPNVPLLLGSAILLILLLVVLFPDLFANQNPYTIQHLRFIHEGESLDIQRAPFAPDDDYLLGSDHLGRDIFSYIIYGTRLTLGLGLFVALSEFLLAVPLALIAGFGNRTIKNLIEKFNVLFSAIPALLIAIIVLNLDYFSGQEKVYSVVSFVVVLTAVGWARVGVLVIERVEGILIKPFIKGEVAIGKSSLKIATENVLPHLGPELVVLFFMEVARSLSMLMQLGIFAVFVGNLGLINDASAGVPINIDISYEPEWASMLSTSRVLLTTAPWAVLYPALAFFISVLGFNLFGEGLRLRGDRHPEGNTIQKGHRVIFVGIFAAIVSLAVLNHKDYSVGYAEVPSLPQTVFVGTETSQQVAYEIANKMQTLGIVPLKDTGYILPYDLGQTAMLTHQKMVLTTENQTHVLKPNVDFAFLSTNDLLETAFIYDARKLDLFTMQSPNEFDHKFVVIDHQYYSERAMASFIDKIENSSSAKGILLVPKSDKPTANLTVQSKYGSGIPIIEITEDLADTLSKNQNVELTVEAETELLQPYGYNVVGILPGSDPYIGEEAIVVGLGYNYLDPSGEAVLKFNLNLMEAISGLSENRRSVIFVFLDGTLTEWQHGIHALSEDFPYSSQDIQVYVDLTGVTRASFGTIEFSADQAPITRQFSWSLARHMASQLTKTGQKIAYLKSIFIEDSYYFTENPSDNAMFWNRGIPSIILGTRDPAQATVDVEVLGRIILKAISDNNY